MIQDYLGRGAARRRLAALLAVSIPILAACAQHEEVARGSPVERGRYLVQLGGCNDCHTPGYFLGKPDSDRYLGGSDVGFAVPGLGVFVGPNLTPDPETGLGRWSEAEIVHALKTGERPDGRILADIMPWRAFSKLDDADLRGIAAYLKTLRPVAHRVAGPLGPDQPAPIFTLRLTPPTTKAP